MAGSNQKVLGYLKIIDKTSPVFNVGRDYGRLIKRRDEITLEITKRDSKFVYYYDDPTAKFFTDPPCKTTCERKIEVICGQDVCDTSGFGRPIVIGGSSTRNVGGGAGGGGAGGGGGGGIGGGVPCISPPCYSVECPNPPCGEEEEEPLTCENSVGSGSCCFNTDVQNCCYVTCYKKIHSPSEEEPNCCGEGELVNSPSGPVCLNEDGTYSGIACDDPANVQPGNIDLCTITKKYCLTGTNDSGNMVFSAEDGSGSVSFNPNTGQFTPPSGGDENEIDALPCDSSGYDTFESTCGCLSYGCACRKTGDEVEQDGGDLVLDVMYVECEHGDLYVGMDDVPDLGEVPDPSGETDAIFLNSTNICDDPDGRCTSYTLIRYCVTGCPDPTFTIKKVPGCSVSWRPPSEDNPPEYEWGENEQDDLGGISWTPGGVAGGGPSSECDCGG